MIPTESESRAWMAAWKQVGDQAAGKALIDAFYPFVISLIRKHVADFGVVEDLTQQTFVRCLTKADQWQMDRPLEPWLARIAINLCRDYFRSRRGKRELRWSDLSENEQAAMEATLQTSESEAEADVLSQESKTLMFRLLDTLNADDRMVLSLLYLENQTTDQVARVSGWSRTLVKVRAFRARRKLRKAFEQLEKAKP